MDCLILARGGSKGVPKKNIKQFTKIINNNLFIFIFIFKHFYIILYIIYTKIQYNKNYVKL